MLTILGLGEISIATILSKYEDISNFSTPNKMLTSTGLEHSIIQSYTIENNRKIVKHGSGHLRYSPTFYDYYLNKRSKDKCHRVALSHICKKLIKVIFLFREKQH